ncbi:uncharacterized protein LOC115222450 [Octopus sinensis]|uniref:Uncharacterized protein LOC115222450 n=1 Tax=Octopus sinensis TaxID=2607531 RepID=A0A6P7TF05_9MOLL|nr:uncharacterized protein LOC115222450 [Octopus sinensis]
MAASSRLGKKLATKTRLSASLDPKLTTDSVNETRKYSCEKSDYKRKHTIGRRRAVSRVVTYDESVPLYEAFVRAAELREKKSETARDKNHGNVSTPSMSSVRENDKGREDISATSSTTPVINDSTKTKKYLRSVNHKSNTLLSSELQHGVKKRKNLKRLQLKNDALKMKNQRSEVQIKKQTGKGRPKKSASLPSSSMLSSKRTSSLRTKKTISKSNVDNLLRLNKGKKLSVCLIRLKREASLNAAAKVNLIYNESLQSPSSTVLSSPSSAFCSSHSGGSKQTTQTHALGSRTYRQMKKNKHKIVNKTKNARGLRLKRDSSLATISSPANSLTPSPRSSSSRSSCSSSSLWQCKSVAEMITVKKRKPGRRKQHDTSSSSSSSFSSPNRSKRQLKTKTKKHKGPSLSIAKKSLEPKKSRLKKCHTVRSTRRQQQQQQQQQQRKKKSKELEERKKHLKFSQTENLVKPVLNRKLKECNIHELDSSSSNLLQSDNAKGVDVISSLPVSASKKRNLGFMSAQEYYVGASNIKSIPAMKKHRNEYLSPSKLIPSNAKTTSSISIPLSENRKLKFQTSLSSTCRRSCYTCRLQAGVRLKEFETRCEKANEELQHDANMNKAIMNHGQCAKDCITCHLGADMRLNEYECDETNCKINMNDGIYQGNDILSCHLRAGLEKYRVGCEADSSGTQCHKNCIICHHFSSGMGGYHVGCENKNMEGERNPNNDGIAVVNACRFVQANDAPSPLLAPTSTLPSHEKNCSAALENSVTLMQCCHQRQHHHRHHHHLNQHPHLSPLENPQNLFRNQNPAESSKKQRTLKKLEHNEAIDEDLDVVTVPDDNPATKYLNFNVKDNYQCRAMSCNVIQEKFTNANEELINKRLTNIDISTNDSHADCENLKNIKSLKLPNDDGIDETIDGSDVIDVVGDEDISASPDYRQNLISNFKFGETTLGNDNRHDHQHKHDDNDDGNDSSKQCKSVNDFKFEKLTLTNKQNKKFGFGVAVAVSSGSSSSSSSLLANEFSRSNCYQSLNSNRNDSISNTTNNKKNPGKSTAKSLHFTNLQALKSNERLDGASTADAVSTPALTSAKDTHANYPNLIIIGDDDNKLIYPTKRSATEVVGDVHPKKRCYKYTPPLDGIGSSRFPSSTAGATTTTSFGLCSNKYYYCSSSSSNSSSNDGGVSNMKNTFVSNNNINSIDNNKLGGVCAKELYCSNEEQYICYEANCQKHSPMMENSLRKVPKSLADLNIPSYETCSMTTKRTITPKELNKLKLSRIGSLQGKTWGKHTMIAKGMVERSDKCKLTEKSAGFNEETCGNHPVMAKRVIERSDKCNLSGKGADFHGKNWEKHNTKIAKFVPRKRSQKVAGFHGQNWEKDARVSNSVSGKTFENIAGFHGENWEKHTAGISNLMSGKTPENIGGFHGQIWGKDAVVSNLVSGKIFENVAGFDGDNWEKCTTGISNLVSGKRSEKVTGFSGQTWEKDVRISNLASGKTNENISGRFHGEDWEKCTTGISNLMSGKTSKNISDFHGQDWEKNAGVSNLVPGKASAKITDFDSKICEKNAMITNLMSKRKDECKVSEKLTSFEGEICGKDTVVASSSSRIGEYKTAEKFASFEGEICGKPPLISKAMPEGSDKFKISQKIASFDGEIFDKNAVMTNLMPERSDGFKISNKITSFDGEICDKNAVMTTLMPERSGEFKISEKIASFAGQTCDKSAVILKSVPACLPSPEAKRSGNIASFAGQTCDKSVGILKAMPAHKSSSEAKLSADITSFDGQPCDKSVVILKSIPACMPSPDAKLSANIASFDGQTCDNCPAVAKSLLERKAGKIQLARKNVAAFDRQSCDKKKHPVMSMRKSVPKKPIECKFPKEIACFDATECCESHFMMEESLQHHGECKGSKNLGVERETCGKSLLTKGSLLHTPSKVSLRTASLCTDVQSCKHHLVMEELSQLSHGKSSTFKGSKRVSAERESCRKSLLMKGSPSHKPSKTSSRTSSLSRELQSSCKKHSSSEGSLAYKAHKCKSIAGDNLKMQPCTKHMLREKPLRKSSKLTEKATRLDLKTESCSKHIMPREAPVRKSSKLTEKPTGLDLKAQMCRKFAVTKECESLPVKASKRIASLNAQAIMDLCQETRQSRRDLNQDSHRSARTHYIFNPRRQSCRWVNGLGMILMNNMADGEDLSNEDEDILSQKMLSSCSMTGLGVSADATKIVCSASGTNSNTICSGVKNNSKKLAAATKNNNNNNNNNISRDVDMRVLSDISPSDDCSVDMQIKKQNSSSSSNNSSSGTTTCDTATLTTKNKNLNSNSASSLSSSSSSKFSNVNNIVSHPKTTPSTDSTKTTHPSCSSLPCMLGATGAGRDNSTHSQCQAFTLTGIGSITNFTNVPYHPQTYGRGQFSVPCSHYGYYPNGNYCSHPTPMVPQLSEPCVLSHSLPIHVPHAEVKVLIHNPIPTQPLYNIQPMMQR